MKKLKSFPQILQKSEIFKITEKEKKQNSKKQCKGNKQPKIQ